MSAKKLFIIDAMAMIFRNFHAFGQNQLKNSKGLPTSALYGSFQFLLKLIETEYPDYIVIAKDSKAKTFRHELYPLYKANRSEMPEDLAVQLPYADRLFDALGCKVLINPGMEADDIIGSLTKKFAGPNCLAYIVSGDKDFMQLVNSHVYLYIPKKDQMPSIVDSEGVKQKFGCEPKQVVDVLALMGDSSDNVPGVKGIGEKGAASLISSYQTLEGIYEHIDDIANGRIKKALLEGKESAFLSRELVTIHTEIDNGVTLEDLRWKGQLSLENEPLKEILTELEFKNHLRSLEQKNKQPDPNLRKMEPSAQLYEVRTATEATADLTPSSTTLEKHRESQQDFPLNTPVASTEQTPPPSPQQPTSPPKYTLIRDLNSFTDLLSTLITVPAFAFDSETTGLDISQDVPIGFSFALRPNEAFYLTLDESHLASDLSRTEILQKLAPIFINKNITKIGHNIKFDMQMCANIGLILEGPYADTMLMSYLLEPQERSHNLDRVTRKYIGIDKISIASLIGNQAQKSMCDTDINQLAEYACEDADMTFRLYETLMPLVKASQQESVFRTIECPLIPVLASMEHTGVFVEAAMLDKLSLEFSDRLKLIEEEIYHQAGEKFNIHSPKQLQVILYEKLKLPELLGIKRLKKTKTGYSTDVSVLELMSDHPLPKLILDYRGLAKLKNTYVDTLPQLISSKTGNIHTSFHQTGTATGRLSSSAPNLQNIPIRSEDGRKIRAAFKPSGKNCVIVSADYSQIELRLLAHLSKDEGLISAFKNGEDIHSATAEKIFGPDARGDRERRSQAKAINFGIIYGMGAQRLAKETGVSLKEAKEFMERYFASYPGIKIFISKAQAFAKSHGYSLTLTGRRRPIPEIHTKNPGVLASALNIAVNSPIQGSAADLIKIAMIKIHESIMINNMKARLTLQVHDELVFNCPNEEREELLKLVRHDMQSAMDLSVPLIVSIGVGATWLEAHS